MSTAPLDPVELPLPLTVLAGLSVTLRDVTVHRALDHVPGLLVVLCDTSELQTRSVVGCLVLDASGVLESAEVRLEHGCVSCTLREAVLPLLVRLGESGRWARCLLALPAGLEPHALADAVVRTQLEGRPVSQVLRLDTVTTVVDLPLLRGQLSGDELLDDLGLATGDRDRRSVAEVVARQIEFADVLLVQNAERLSQEHTTRIRDVLSHLAPHAIQVVGATDVLDAAQALFAGLFDGAAAAGRVAPGTIVANTPDTASDVRTVSWRATRPVHPGLLAQRLTAITGKAHRCRGHLWLATHPVEALAFESWGASASLGILGPWDASGTPPGCHLTLSGIGLDPAQVCADLDGCLLDDDLLAAGPIAWRDLPNPFEDAVGNGA